MALQGNPRWGDACAAAVNSVGIVAGTPITDEQRKLIWRAICDEHETEITGNAVVSTTVTGTLPNGPVAASGTGSVA